MQQFIIVKNNTNPLVPVPIKELNQVIPPDGKFYKLPYQIAVRYKQHLAAIRVIVEDNTPKIKEEPKTYTTEIRNTQVKIGTATKPLKGKKIPASKKESIKKAPKKKVIKETINKSIVDNLPFINNPGSE